MRGFIKTFWNKTKLTVLQLQVLGNAELVNGQDIIATSKDPSGNITEANGIVTISDGGSGYAKGCRYIDTDVGAGISGEYVNIGTSTSCEFVKVATV